MFVVEILGANVKDLEELKKLQKTLSDLEQLSKQPGIPEGSLDTSIETLRAQIKRLALHIEIGGNVGAGSAIGDGIVIAERISSDNYFYMPSPDVRSSAQMAEDDYLRAMVGMHSRLSLDSLNQGEAESDQKSPELKDIYIDLNVIETLPVEGKIVASGESRPYAATEAIAAHTHIVLLGGPGSGKSTVLKYLVWYLAARRRVSTNSRQVDLAVKSLPGWQGEKPPLPILISLTKLAQWLMHNDEPPHLENYVQDMLMKLDLQDSAQHIRALIRRSDVILLLDGLDEVTNPENCKKLIRVVNDCVDRHPDIRIVVTCRILSYTNPELHLKHFTTQTLAPLVDEQIHLFIQNWYEQLIQRKQIPRFEATNRAKYLEQMITRRLTELSNVPLLLTVIIIIYERTGDLPHEKARLYYRCCEVLMWHWQKAKLDSEGKIQPGISESLETPEHLLMTALMHLAFEQYEHQRTEEGTPEIREAVVLSRFRPYFQANRPDAWKKAALFLEYIQDRAGLLVAEGSTGNDAIYTFVHRTFQEFLAARYLTTQGNFAEKVVELFYGDESDRWHEVVLLAIGHLVFNQSSFADAIDTAEKLIAAHGFSEQQKWRAVWWAAEILAVVGPVATELNAKGKKLLPVVRQGLATVLTEGRLSPRQRAAAGEALARIGDPRQSVMKSPPLCVPISGGHFIIGARDDDPLSSPGERPSSSVELAAFEVGMHPVTNAQYRLFINDDGYTEKHRDCWTPQGWLWKEENQWSGSESIDDLTSGIDNKPVVGVSWFEAVAYTCWLSKSHATCYRLPTEAEWERVARGINGWRYPWGDTWIDEAANTKELGLDGPTSVGIFSLSTSPEGCTDLVGNVWEWCQSLLKEYPYRADDGRENPDTAGPRVARGGCYHNAHTLARCTYRLWRFPGFRNSYIGFRVVKAN